MEENLNSFWRLVRRKHKAKSTMSSILKTIDVMRKLCEGDYVQFHTDKFGYIDRIISDSLVRIKEGSSKSMRFRHYNVPIHLVSIVSISGSTSTQNRNQLSPPSPPERMDQRSENNIDNDSKELISVLKETRMWTDNKNKKKHPFFEYLKNGINEEKGWIRNKLPRHLRSNVKQLTSEQKTVFVTTHNIFEGFSKRSGVLKNWIIYFNHAWNVNKQTTNRIIDSYYLHGFSTKRLERSDKGETLINSEKKRKSVYSPLYVFKREQTQRRFRNYTHRLNELELKEEFESKREDEKNVYKNLANEFVAQGCSLHHNIIKTLIDTKGNVTYSQIANHIGGFITERTVAKHLKSIDGYAVVKSRILPQLTRDAKLKRLIFCESFFIFWLSARCLKSHVKLIKTHMDEKWVMAVRTKTNIKIIMTHNPDSRYHHAHHKNYLDQVMFVVINGFIPKDNDLLGNGGRSVKVSCIPVGSYEPASKNSYKRVYDDDGTYEYPEIEENI